jgi:predicted nucleotidyltransferase
MPFDPERYAAGLRRENEREVVAIRESARRARAEAHRLAAEIGASDAGVRVVYLFGSLTSGEPQHLDFDIDLALDGGDVYAADEIAESSPFEVDVVSLARLPEEKRNRIRESGEVLFTRGGRDGDLDTLHPGPDSGSSGKPTCFR